MIPSIDPFLDLAKRYAEYSALQQEVCSRLLERVEHRRTEPKRIVCLGCGDGQAPRALKKQFRKAQVIALDESPSMLALAAKKSTLLRPFARACARIDALPIADRSVDLLFANLAGHWRYDGAALMDGYRRVLKPDGMLLFSSLGVGSFSSLVLEGDGEILHPGFAAFEDILRAGDQMMTAGFRQPVMDTDRLTLSYPGLTAMCQELEGSGMTRDASRWAAWKQALIERPDALMEMKQEERLHLRYEIIYGAAFAPEDGQPVRQGQGEVATFSVESLRKSAKKSP